MKTSHPDDFKKYGAELNNIIASPDYVGKNAKDDSIEFTKEFCINGEFVKVAVRVSTRKHILRTFLVCAKSKPC